MYFQRAVAISGTTSYVQCVGLLILLFSIPSFAWSSTDIHLGVGHGVPFTGRFVPEVHLGIGRDNLLVSGYASGVKTTIYHQSAYQLAGYYLWHPGKIFTRDVVAGFGLGTFYSKTGYYESEVKGEKTSSSFVAGPSIRVFIYLLGPVYLSLESIFGVYDVHPLLINFQDVASFSLGVKF